MRDALSSRVQHLSSSPTLALDEKVKALQTSGIPVINLGLGEPDFPTPLYIRRAAALAMARGFTHYTETPGILELRKAITRKLLSDNHIHYQPSEIVVGVGTKQVLYHAFQALCGRGDEVLVPTPTWTTYVEQIKLSGATPVFIPLLPPFKLTAQDVQNKVSRHTKALLLNSPSNPTGAVIKKSELIKIAHLAKKKGFFVISDEIYEKIFYKGQHHSIASLGAGIEELTLTVNGFSKAYAMTGWRIGYAAGPKWIIQAITSLQSQTTSNTSSIAQKAALAALSGSQKSLNLMFREFQTRRQFLINALSKINGISFAPPEGAFYFFIDVRRLLKGKIRTSAKWCARLLDEKKIAVVPGEAFLAPGYVRLSFAAPLQELQKAVEQIRDFTQEH
ncbi:MAG: pyridoxal phosphate-dependent aminotransferase [Candidatus Liptonbacteria bacterium]|nr:pyridoxal phosphate-dependent aminotransferase [Candidatus Liptonbacteria bacterium]